MYFTRNQRVTQGNFLAGFSLRPARIRAIIPDTLRLEHFRVLFFTATGVFVAAEEIDVAYVAQLANIRLTPEEERLFQRQIPVILAYVDKLRGLDVAGIEPTSHGQRVCNVFREDAVEPGLDAERVLANAPARIGDAFKVPRMVES